MTLVLRRERYVSCPVCASPVYVDGRLSFHHVVGSHRPHLGAEYPLNALPCATRWQRG
jgi:hypothetical protein